MDWFSFEIKMRDLISAMVEPLARRVTDVKSDCVSQAADLYKLEHKFLEFEN